MAAEGRQRVLRSPLLFFVQVTTRQSDCSIRSDNVCLILLQCPEVCRYLAFSAVSIIEGCAVCLTLLVLLCGDVQLNLGSRNAPQVNLEALLS